MKSKSKLKKNKVKHNLILHKTNPKKEDFSDRLITVSAPQRTGKSSFIVSLVRQIYKYQNKTRVKETNEFIDSLNSIRVNGKRQYKLSKSPYGHYIYSSKGFSFYLDKKHEKKTIIIDPKELGLPNLVNTFKHLPYGSIIVIDEADKYWPNREWQDTSQEFIDLMKYIGHNHLTLILITQVYGNLDKKIRELSMEHYHILGRVVKPKHWFFKEKFIWYYDKTYPQEILRANELKDLGMDVPKPRVEHCKFVYKDNPHKYYNSRSGLPLFLYKIKDYDYELHPDDNRLDREAVNKVAGESKKKVIENQVENEYKLYKFLEKRSKINKMKSELYSEYVSYVEELTDS